MRYKNVCLEAFGYVLPDEIVTSQQLEERLEPVYSRLKLSVGRLELMTGIRQRRVWPEGTLPSEISITSAQRAIDTVAIDPEMIGALVHGSVCRDYLEPATACSVHRGLGLANDCLIYDLSNACLGLLDGIVQVANMIELGQIRAGLVVGTESSRQLLDTTIDQLLADPALSREQLKGSLASLTIGSGSAAVLLVDRELSRTDNRLRLAVPRAETGFHALCRSGRDEAVAQRMQPSMRTDSEALLREGVRVARHCFDAFLAEAGWDREQVDKAFCHQVGAAHRKLLLEELALPAHADFPTVEYLGNTGSVALPLTAAIGIEQGHLQPADRVALLGIGSGINALMLGVEWQTSLLHPDRPRVEARSAVASGS